MILQKDEECKLLIEHLDGGSYEQPLPFLVGTVHFNVELSSYVITDE